MANSNIGSYGYNDDLNHTKIVRTSLKFLYLDIYYIVIYYILIYYIVFLY